MSTIKYKGFTGSVHFAADDTIYYGKLEDISKPITFEGSTLEELEKCFRFAVDEHLTEMSKSN